MAKILVVDDDANVQRTLRYTLEQEGYEVLQATDGAEGFRLWGVESPALILLDVMLPKLDGYQVAAKIRAEEGASGHVPDHHAHGRARGRAEGPRPARRRRRLPDQAVPSGRAARPHPQPARPVRAAGHDGRCTADGPDPRLLWGEGRRRHDDDRDQPGDRVAPRARAEGRPRRPEPAVRRPPRVPRPRPRSARASSMSSRRRRSMASSSRASSSSTTRASTCSWRRRRRRPPSSSPPPISRSSSTCSGRSTTTSSSTSTSAWTT